MKGYSTSCLHMTPSLPQTCCALPMVRMTSGQLSSDCHSSRPRYLNIANPYISSSSSFLVKLNSISIQQLVTYTPLRLIFIAVFLKQRAFLWCLSSRPLGMCIILPMWIFLSGILYFMFVTNSIILLLVHSSNFR